ncbi:MAG: glutathione S-transferase N-terminal domain-containing protein [Hyphomicrobiales bacterium]|nr:glutathione S-transferase N-terminal domain-containing protein [Hyphomicrobiales bacterium]
MKAQRERNLLSEPQDRNMITLYGMTSPNVVKIIIALEEVGLPHEFKPVDVFTGQQFDPAFVKLNPNAKVPVIVDSDGPGGKPYTVFESGAILLYLAEKTGKFLPTECKARYDVIQWLMVQLTGVGPMFGQFVHFFRFAPQGNDYSVSRYRTQVKRVCDVLEARLGEAAYLGGAEYSIADMATFPWARNLKMLFGEGANAYPKILAWVEKIEKRPAVARSIEKVEKLRATLTPFDKAKPEILDKIFGRGQHALT